MRIQITFSLKEHKLPLAYRMMMVSFIKHCIRLDDLEYYHNLFDEKKQLPKPYTFAVHLNSFEIQDNNIVTDGFRMNLSCGDYECFIHLFNGIQKTHNFRYRDYEISREQIRFLPEPETSSSQILCKTLSPILVENENNQPLAPWEKEYNLHLNRITNQMIQTQLKRSLHMPLQLTPQQMKKVVIKESNETFRESLQSSKRYLYFTAYKGTMLLKGHPADLNYLLKTGIGLRNSQSFGMIDLVKEVNHYEVNPLHG
ncbi:MAG: CRISPR-associated endoribonuclease Cas6 [Bacillaceae bacterium]|nr:CRISPR-associated endoribonuclease Cas6 [Bacillaceae bacterium]